MSYETMGDAGRAMVDRAIDVLNEMVAADRDAVELLVETRVPCNEALADHPTVQVHTDGERHWVGLLGVVNGIIGVDDDGWGFIAAEFDDRGKLVQFKRTPPRKSSGKAT